ncbi:MAG: radical SAM protein, partial [Coriobacteriales bacterium]|nr:radical SAM protein [Coriobacteriales bacterium]
MQIRKIRFIEPGNPPYRRLLRNLWTYEEHLRNPSIGLLTLTTIVKDRVEDTLMYSESISYINWDDVLDADIVFLGMFSFAAPRGYELAEKIRANSSACVVIGGLHASLNVEEAAAHCDYVLLGEADESILEFIDCLERDVPVSFPGVAWLHEGALTSTGKRLAPQDINTIPNRDLIFRYRKMAGHNTLWPQVHASRGCPDNCDYCVIIQHFGRRVRTRCPENIVEDIRQAIAFHDDRPIPRLTKALWVTDDNFFADRAWALSVLKAIIASDVRYRFTIQARYEVGFDDEMLDLLKRAGFVELAMGIEFMEDESFALHHKKSRRDDIIRAIHNIQRHGIRVRGLFMMGADTHSPGIGERLAAFVEEHEVRGVLIQSMY